MSEMGELTKKLREARQISLRESSGKWSLSSMSRFENGEIDLTDDVVAELSFPLGLDYEDLILRGIIKESGIMSWQCLVSEQWDAERAQALLRKLKGLLQPAAKNGFLEVSIAVINELLRIHAESDQNMRDDVVRKLNHYLMNISEFSRLEGILYSACSEYVPLDIGWQWVKRHFKMLKLESAPPQLVRRVLSFAAATAERAAIERRFDMMRQILNQMNQLKQFIPENGSQWFNLQVYEALYTDFTESSEMTHRRFVKVIKAGAFILPQEVVRSMIRYTIAQGWAAVNDFADADL
jgi:hypothetical protein